jgi:putative ABC transport system substrate-binding protein
MNRRELMMLAAAVSSVPPGAVRAEQDGMRLIGLLLASSADNPLVRPWIAALLDGLKRLGWRDGDNVRIEIRWAEGSLELARKHAAELSALKPDVILVAGTAVDGLLQVVTSDPVVFVLAVDPVGSGFVQSLSRPGRNATGFMQFDYSLSAKWAELLKQTAPGLTRAAVIRDPDTTAGIGQFAVIQSVAQSVGLDVIPMGVRNPDEIDSGLAEFARIPRGGMIVTSGAVAAGYRGRIITAAARHQLPAIYPNRFYADDGGLISYGADFTDQFRLAAGYVDRILRGEKPSDMPVQAPTKYQLIANLRTAKTSGIDIPALLLARADEVIE